MSIAPLRRVALLGAAVQRMAVLASLQALGVMHLDGLEETLRAARRRGGSVGDRAREALRYLASTPRLRAQARHDGAFEVHGFVEAVLANKEAQRQAADARDALDKRLSALRPWGNFAFPFAPEDIGARLWFYEVQGRDLPKLKGFEHPWIEASRADGLAYVVVISPEEPRGVPGVRAHLGAKGLKTLQAEREALELRLDELAFEREGMTRRLSQLAESLAQAEDQGVLALAQRLGSEDELFVLTGWAHVKDIPALEALAAAEGAVLAAGPAGADDAPPTLLAPAPLVAAGADLTRLYQLPGAKEWDPSAAVFVSFSIFFALILSDAGYGAVLLGLSLLAWPGLGGSALGLRLRPLCVAASLAACVWGVLVGSYFGASPPHPWLAAAHRLSLDDFEAMMALTVAVGAAHVGFACAAAAWAARGQRQAFASLGWLMAIIAGGCAALGFSGLAIGLGVAAAAAVIVGSGGLVRGALALTKITSLFADILSYLRLFALGLAGASLAIAFNDLARQAHDAAGGLGVLAGGLVLVIGHGLNLVLSVMGGLVHGLRLNLIEFFNWGMQEEGRAFVPFARIAKGRA